MSASRPKLAKPKAKPKPFHVEKPDLEIAGRSTTSSPAASGPSAKVKKSGAAGSVKKPKNVALGGGTTSAVARRNVASSSTTAGKGKGRAGMSCPKSLLIVQRLIYPAPRPTRPAGTASEPEVLSSSDDDFEEVPIPTTPGGRIKSANASAGPSSPYPYSHPGTPNTPGTNMTARTSPAPTTAGETEEDPYAEDDESADEGDGVIRLEIGGETEEQKAKRIALALRK